MKDIYRAPRSSLVEVKGIDGKTCPKCGETISLFRMVFKTLVPNRYTCPECKAKVGHDFHPMFITYLFVTFSVIFVTSLYFLEEVMGITGSELMSIYLKFVVLPGVIVGLGIQIYARKKEGTR
ncbi:hypothetical protein BTA51_28770 [Hahella sp. CCB-MM4]|uniref:hypothetical protein n=1 Tax=Hahella sp. (strain CCB-MM4) TaxID=1926491 RepID=UPI000B9B2A45|nr:hypothetical protein [Hahella sp. CCB-MM4]OZG69907.1 hypothetical protein BTA51_28770 [Hahella sp. CCB-MM4]